MPWETGLALDDSTKPLALFCPDDDAQKRLFCRACIIGLWVDGIDAALTEFAPDLEVIPVSVFLNIRVDEVLAEISPGFEPLLNPGESGGHRHDGS